MVSDRPISGRRGIGIGESSPVCDIEKRDCKMEYWLKDVFMLCVIYIYMCVMHYIF